MSSSLAEISYREASSVAVPTVFLIFSVLAVVLRAYVRKRLLRVFLVEDWLCVLTLVFFITQTGLLFEFDSLLQSFSFDFGTFEKIINALQVVISDVVLYLCSSITPKLSLAFFILRFLLERWQRMLVYAMLAIFVADSVASMFLVLFWCSDPTQYAAKTLSDQCVGTINGLNAVNILQAILNAMADWLFATLPVIIIFRATTMDKREKLMVAGIFAFAITGSVAAILRAVFWPALTHGTFSGFRTGMTWCTIEIGADLVASSAATLRPLFEQLHLFKIRRRETSGTDHSGQGVAHTDSEAKQSNITSTCTVSITHKEWWDLEPYTSACQEALPIPGSAAQGRCD
ncbi:hypothetical protein M436DRAFT_57781 [Aureobasidium namibiae CBS 147.97]|uniref:Rhodopsin domain-containing protein n=1 Tax=Aureobasidium namibiae CBS 147.97 TaxID=1043004 RepID=A0A074WAU8_9PEZI